jgi:UDP-N-acetylglucosamine--N-acetylmuramyl-(pentapeptide) pyrophosphoryl-undecaprenol N-acetylglucosamine transferase
MRAKKIIKNFAPDIVIGVGGYASGPILRSAVSQKIPTLIQEQNSYPGVTNKILADGVNRICVAYENMERWFPANKIVFTGNPIRQNISLLQNNIVEIKNKALSTFNLVPHKPIVLVVGGSLGALTVNESIINNLDYFVKNNIQLIWQTGKWFFEKAQERVSQINSENIKVYEFIYEMEQAYSLANVIISRAGAIAISELCIVGKPCILVPSPNVSEDHQTKNANALVSKSAAIMVKDIESREKLIGELDRLINNEALQQEMSENITKLGIRDADKRIVEQIELILGK